MRYLMSACYAISGIGLFLMVLVQGGPLIIVFPLCYGIGAGGFMPLSNLMWANYFGRANLGIIKGVFLPITQIMGAFSPLFAGYTFDATGSYDPAYLLFTVTFVVRTVAIFLARRPMAGTEADGKRPLAPPVLSRKR